MSAMLTMPSVADVRCPACQSVDWFQDGCVIALSEGAIVAGCTRVQNPDPSLRDTTWSCNHCSYELVAGSQVARVLDQVRQRTCDHPV